MDRVSAFFVGNTIGLTVLFAGILISAPKKMKESEAIQKQELQRAQQEPTKKEATKNLPERSAAPGDGSTDDAQPKGPDHDAFYKSANHQPLTNSAHENEVKALNALNIVATKDIRTGKKIDAQNIALPTASGNKINASIMQTLFGKTAKVEIHKGTKIEAQLLESD